jgi:hypothetical protein
MHFTLEALIRPIIGLPGPTLLFGGRGGLRKGSFEITTAPQKCMQA